MTQSDLRDLREPSSKPQVKKKKKKVQQHQKVALVVHVQDRAWFLSRCRQVLTSQ